MTNKKNKLAIIGTVGLPANYGGFETLTDHLVRNLGDEYDMTVYCSKHRYKREERKEKYLNAKLVYLPFNANGVQSIIYDGLSILHSLFFADVLLILGVAGAWLLPFVRLFTNKKIIISIDGIEWKRDKWSPLAKRYLKWAEKLAVKYSDIDISDNESIQDYTADRYGSLSRIIEYGADHTLFVKPNYNDKKEYSFLKLPYACKVCRIVPENNCDQILKAFSELPKHTLVMIGNWNNSQYGQNLKAQYSSFSNIILLDPIYDQRTLDMIRGNALVYIHGHSAGGTNPSLVEAMYLELPIISFAASYNITTTEGKALYFKNYKELKTIIENVEMQELIELASTMKEIAMRRYVWKVIANKYNYYLKEVFSTTEKGNVYPNLSKVEDKVLLENNAAHLKNQNLFYE